MTAAEVPAEYNPMPTKAIEEGKFVCHTHRFKCADENPYGTGSELGIPRYSCGRCGATCFHDEGGGNWEVATGLIDYVVSASVGNDDSPEGQSVKVADILDRVQMNIGSTVDAGAAIWINGGKLEGQDRRLEGRKSEVLTDDKLRNMVKKSREQVKVNKTPASLSTEHKRSQMKGSCACGLLKLVISRDSNDIKHHVNLCVCTSCRKTAGFDVVAWFTAAKKNVAFSTHRDQVAAFNSNQEFALTESEELPVRHYSSSPGVSRIFCGKCGSKLLYFKTTEGSNECDINPGIFKEEASRQGVRLEEWLKWQTKKVDGPGESGIWFVEEAIDPDLVNGLVEGAGLEHQNFA